MPAVIITDSGSALTEHDIEAAENAMGVRFPDDYRHFLLQNNGGKPDPNMFLIPDHPIPGQSDLLDWFYCIVHDSPIDIISACRAFKGRVPEECLSIGCDPGGNQICLVISGTEQGKIYFWDHEEEADEGEEPTYGNMYLIADSLNDLLNNKLIEVSW
ncbi:MAG: SMI1/KNR4 family protein [Anaerolineae bacterium]|nr:SMI1/KNR4 family protein [Anaerolineae bacterium]